MNACVIKEQVLWGTVDIAQTHMQKAIEVNILILTILIAAAAPEYDLIRRLLGNKRLSGSFLTMLQTDGEGTDIIKICSLLLKPLLPIHIFFTKFAYQIFIVTRAVNSES